MPHSTHRMSWSCNTIEGIGYLTTPLLFSEIWSGQTVSDDEVVSATPVFILKKYYLGPFSNHDTINAPMMMTKATDSINRSIKRH